jgi:hypothetical protein
MISDCIQANINHAIAEVVICWLYTVVAWVQAHVRSCGICGGNNDTGQVSSKYFSFSSVFSLHQLLHINSHAIIHALQRHTMVHEL